MLAGSHKYMYIFFIPANSLYAVQSALTINHQQVFQDTDTVGPTADVAANCIVNRTSQPQQQQAQFW